MPLGLILLLVALPLAGATRYDFDTETTWRKVTWDDFKGRGPSLGRATSASGARISLTIKLSRFRVETARQDEEIIATPVGVEAYAIMDKLLSGVESSARNDRVLAHEQLHFDLAEAYARRLDVAVVAARGRGATEAEASADLDRVLQATFDEYGREVTALQSAYDRESKHGTKKRQQREWAKRITQLLANSPSRDDPAE